MKIALNVLVYNGEPYVRETIGNFISLVDEVNVVLDSRCNDNTRAILTEMGVRFNEFKWQHDFSKVKNSLLAMTSKDVDWIIALSEDNKIKPEECKKLVDYIATLPDNVGGLKLPQKSHYPKWTYDEDDCQHKIKGLEWVYPNSHLCVFRNLEGLKSVGRVHEVYTFPPGFNVIEYKEVHRHHHAWRGERERDGNFKHNYYTALMQLPPTWNVGDELPELKGVNQEIIDYLKGISCGNQ